MIWSSLKSLIPAREKAVPILWGPFRGARIQMVPRDNLRKMLGLYEHELNDWLEAVLPRVRTVLDVGANNGYFTFGCAAAFRRLKKPARIIAFEPEESFCELMRASAQAQTDDAIDISIRQSLVGKERAKNVETLDAVAAEEADLLARPALIKIDVEGAEIDVIAGASRWLTPQNYFLVEVHRREYLPRLQEHFAGAGLRLEQRDQRPLPFLGREARREENWWLVTPIPDDRIVNHA